MRILNTEAADRQVYVPWDKMGCCSVLRFSRVFAFQSSASLAFEFGMAVDGTITIARCVLSYVARKTGDGPRGGDPAAGRQSDVTCLSSPPTDQAHEARWCPLLSHPPC